MNTLGGSFFILVFSGNQFVLDRFRVEIATTPASNNKDVSMDDVREEGLFAVRGTRCI